MITGLLIAFGPVLFGLLAIERWRRQVARDMREAELRELRRSAAWEAVTELERAA